MDPLAHTWTHSPRSPTDAPTHSSSALALPMNEEHDGGENEGHQRAGGGDDVNFVEQVRFPGSVAWVGGRTVDGWTGAGGAE